MDWSDKPVKLTVVFAESAYLRIAFSEGVKASMNP